MDTFWWRAAWGLCLVQLSLAQIDLNITCRYKGVFHVEKNGRYSISKTEAADLCKAFNCTLPTMAQMEAALRAGFETCRYGFIDGHVVIPRIHPNSICAANNTGVYILTSNTSQYDTYCFNASAPPEEDCTSVTDLPNAFEGPITITIVNRDGTRYTKKGEYRTNPDDINPSTTPEEDMSSGSSSERSTSGGYNIFHTHLPTVYPTPDQDSPWVPSNPETTPATTLMSTSGTTSKTATKRQEAQDWFSWWFQPSATKIHLHTTTIMAAQPLMQVTTTGTDSNIISAGWEATEENEDESDRHPSYSGSDTDDDEDFISSTISTTPRVFNHPQQNQDWTQPSPGHSNPEVSLQTTTRMTDVDRSSTSAYGEKWTQETHSSLSHRGYHDEEETQHPTSTTRAPPTSTTEETATQKEQWFENGWPGEYPQMPKEDSHSTAGTTAASARDSHQNQRVTVQSQEDRSWTYFFDPVSHPMGRGHQTERRMDVDTSHSTTLQPSAGPNTGLVEDLDRTGPLSVTTQQSDTQSFSTSRGGLEEDKDHPMTASPTSSNRNDGTGGRRGENLPEDSTTSVEGYTPYSPDTNEYRTLIPVTPAKAGSPEVTVVGDSTSNVDLSLSEDQDSSHDPSGRSYTTHGSESAGHSSGSQERGANTTSGPMRKPQIPEWLIILASLLALALILAVCIAVNSRRRCGQKKKLVINSGNGTMEERKPSGLNGEASKSQEMVHLVNKESSETPDQFMTADERQNLQNVDMKIGV
ncbi:CD44 antigen isoform X1 [Neophocaena asiaeorientalis asiaeorientalis]|uniref:CD44 antigen n=1 Tax=Neophocaena asiaeorientalis asiaeorientalis TaxID=1706337 RepID=A0A341C1B4_NEOAA|nr:CD44 antigen isoform X1 [Neophocaena asiaeorientalis asiaeorientalis]